MRFNWVKFDLNRLGKKTCLAVCFAVAVYAAFYLLLVVALWFGVGAALQPYGQHRLQLSVSTAPVGMSIHAEQLALQTADSLNRVALTLPRLVLPLQTPWQLLFDAGLLTFDGQRADGSPLTMAANNVQLRSVLTLPFKVKLGVRATAVNLPAGPAIADRILIEAVTLNYARRLLVYSLPHPAERLWGAARNIQLPSGTPAGTAVLLDDMIFSKTANPALPRNWHQRAAVDMWQQAGGTVTLDELALRGFGLQLALRGSVQLTAARDSASGLEVTGRGTFYVSGLDQALTLLGSHGVLQAEQLMAAQQLLQFLPGGGAETLPFPLRLDGGRVFFMNAPVAMLPKMPWQP